jgi:hypothetical protein
MLSAAQSRIWDYPALALYPGLMILVVSVAAALLGDALRDAWDPTTDALASTGRAARTNDNGTPPRPPRPPREDNHAHRADRLAT